MDEIVKANIDKLPDRENESERRELLADKERYDRSDYVRQRRLKKLKQRASEQWVRSGFAKQGKVGSTERGTDVY